MRAAIADVVITLFEAVGLVILVVFVFLQNWRATLIPLLTVPVAVVGTFALFPLLGFSINMTSMFGLVLAIGIVVDDAIVVVEAVQHNIDRRHEPARRDACKRMEEVSGPVVAIAFILARGVHSGRVSRRHQRPDLPAVRADHRGFGADLGVQRAVAEPGAVAPCCCGPKRISAACSAALSTASTRPSIGPRTGI